MANGSATESFQIANATQNVRPEYGIFDYVLSWTADSAGSVSYTGKLPVVGLLLDWWTKPGTVAPTNNYTVTAKDPATTDILAAGGTGNRSSTTTQYSASIPSKAITDGVTTATALRAFNGELLTLNVSSAGNGGQGLLYLRFKV